MGLGKRTRGRLRAEEVEKVLKVGVGIRRGDGTDSVDQAVDGSWEEIR